MGGSSVYLSMFIRKKKNKSGSFSFHIVRKDGRRQVLVKVIGTACTEAECNKLQVLARQTLSELLKQGRMKFTYPDDERFVKQLQANIQSVRIAGAELILGKLFDEVGFNQVPHPLFRDLVLCRICYPGSKLRTVDYLLRHQQRFYDIDAVYRYLDKLNRTHKEQLQSISYQHTRQLFNGILSIVFYDVTTLYFEASAEDELRKIGFSKDGKAQNPQIVLGLLVSAEGYPLAFEMFEGNKFEGHTMLPVIEGFKHKFALGEIIVVADAGLLSLENTTALTRLGYSYILGARIRSEPQKVQQKIASQTWRNGQVRSMEEHGGNRLVISYSDARAKKDRHNRERALQRLEKALQKGRLTKEHINNRGYNKYLKLTGEIAVKIDYEKFKTDAAWDGLKGYLTNASLSNDEVIENYRQLWNIEKAFRISKTDLKVRPIFHRLKHRIEAHLMIAFCSYKLIKELERQLKLNKAGISAQKAVEVMQSIFAIQAILPTSGQSVELIMAKTEEQKKLLACFKIDF